VLKRHGTKAKKLRISGFDQPSKFGIYPERHYSTGSLGLPADFLIGSGGRVLAAKYGKYVDDHWSVDELLDLAKNARHTTGASPARTGATTPTTQKNVARAPASR